MVTVNEIKRFFNPREIKNVGGEVRANVTKVTDDPEWERLDERKYKKIIVRVRKSNERKENIVTIIFVSHLKYEAINETYQ